MSPINVEGRKLWTTPEFMMYVTLAAGAAGLITYLLLAVRAPRDDDERPPVVISNGSIDFEADPKHGNHDRVSWVQITERQYIANDPKGAAVTGFNVDSNPHGQTTCTQNGNPYGATPPFNVQTVRVTYGADGVAPQDASMSITAANHPNYPSALQLDLPENGSLSGNKWRVVIRDPGGGIKIKALSFTVRDNVVCKLTYPGQTQITVAQTK